MPGAGSKKYETEICSSVRSPRLKIPRGSADETGRNSIMVSPHEDSELVLNRFNKLVQELLRGNMNRNTFRPWEIEILLDIEHCNLKDGNKKETLRRYQKSVQRQMEKGASRPMKLSEYLAHLKAKRDAIAARGQVSTVESDPFQDEDVPVGSVSEV